MLLLFPEHNQHNITFMCHVVECKASWAKLGACGFFHCGLQPENTVKTTWLQPPSVNQWYCEIFKANG